MSIRIVGRVCWRRAWAFRKGPEREWILWETRAKDSMEEGSSTKDQVMVMSSLGRSVNVGMVVGWR